MSKFVPNSFQVPNALIDDLLAEISGAELKCYLFVVRQTKGWQKNEDSIALSQFMKKTGLAKASVVAACESLCRIGLIQKVGVGKKGVTVYRCNDFTEATCSKTEQVQKLNRSNNCTGLDSDILESIENTEDFSTCSKTEQVQKLNTQNTNILNTKNIGQSENFVASVADNLPDGLPENLPKPKTEKSDNQKRFEAVVGIFNRVFENSKVRTVSLKAQKANEKRIKLIPKAWAIAKDRVMTVWVDENGLIDGEKPNAKHVLEWFESYFTICLKDPFINGESGRNGGHENWKADFDYILRTAVMEKRVYES